MVVVSRGLKRRQDGILMAQEGTVYLWKPSSDGAAWAAGVSMARVRAVEAAAREGAGRDIGQREIGIKPDRIRVDNTFTIFLSMFFCGMLSEADITLMRFWRRNFSDVGSRSESDRIGADTDL